MKIYAFYGAQYLGDDTTIDKIKKIPDGAFIKMKDNWYTMIHSTLSPINKSDVPKEIDVQLLLLGIQK